MVFLVNAVLGPVSEIANEFFFSEKLPVIHWKNGFVSLQFCTLRRLGGFLL